MAVGLFEPPLVRRDFEVTTRLVVAGLLKPLTGQTVGPAWGPTRDPPGSQRPNVHRRGCGVAGRGRGEMGRGRDVEIDGCGGSGKHRRVGNEGKIDGM